MKRDVLALQQRIAVRRAGGTAEATPDMSDIFMRLTASEEMCKEVMEMYQRDLEDFSSETCASWRHGFWSS